MSKEHCHGCIYFGRAGAEPICEYILMERHRRPCPPGAGCTVKKTVGGTDMNRRAWDEARARQLYEEGKRDIDIADMVGVSAATIAEWRRKNHLASKNWPARKKSVRESVEENPSDIQTQIIPSAEAAAHVAEWPIEISFSFEGCTCSLSAPNLDRAQFAAAYLSKSVKELELALCQTKKGVHA